MLNISPTLAPCIQIVSFGLLFFGKNPYFSLNLFWSSFPKNILVKTISGEINIIRNKKTNSEVLLEKFNGIWKKNIDKVFIENSF